MPFPNEHAARLSSPDRFKKFRRSPKGFPKGISAIVGILSTGKSEIQSLRFDKKIWTPNAAKKWLRDHGFKKFTFEAAEVPVKKGLWSDAL